MLTGMTRCATGSSALKRLLWKLLRNSPFNAFVPDLVIAFTCTPVDRPCVASNWLVTNWNSAIESWLKRGWLPAPSSEEICCPSRLSWNSRASPPLRSGSGAVALVEDVRLPGASSASAIQLRPATGSSCTCFGSMLPPSFDVVVSMSGASPVDRHRLLQRRWRHLQVDRRRLADQQVDARAVDGAEAGERRGDPVAADARGNPIDAAAVGHRLEAGCRSPR